MPSRFHKKKLRDLDDVNKTMFFKNPEIVRPILTSSSRVLTDNPAVITLEKMETSNRILFALEYSQSIIAFYDSAYAKIIVLLKMIINDYSITDIIDYAYSLRLYINEQMAQFKDIPGNSASIDTLEVFQKYILDILQNTIDGSEYDMVLYRIEMLQSMITKYKSELQ
jgi:hypothetical protein